ncbi:MAG TPA: diguanylate cyclase [Steroidobacteraceae bacterium]|nr:diguanylate cyclase [Steroidobacteraceae bacterium]
MSIVLSSDNKTGPITRSLSARLVVLIVGDASDAERITRELESSGYTVASQHVDTPAGYAAALDKGSWDIVITARESATLNGSAVVQELRERQLETPVVVLTDRVDEVLSLEAVAAGAEDVLKREDLYRLPYVVGRILQQAQIRHDQAAMLETGSLTLHRRRRGLGLRATLWLILISAVLVAVAAAAWYVNIRTQRAHEQLESRVRDTAITLAQAATHAANPASQKLEPSRELADLVAALARQLTRETLIVDPGKTVIAHSFPFHVGSQFGQDAHNEVGLSLQDGAVRAFVEATGGNPPQIYRLVAPVVSEAGPIVGAVIVNYTSERVELDSKLRAETRYVLLTVGIIAGLGILIFSIVVTQRLLLPVERLRDAATKLSLGSLDIEVPKGPSNEIGDIAVGMDTLRKRLKKSVLARQSDMVQRLRAEEALRQVHLRQRHQIEVTESRAKEVTLLAQMGALLHACATREEACRIIARSIGELFPGLPAALYLSNASTEDLQPVIAQGTLARTATPIAAGECWALRRGQAHVVNRDSADLRCAHAAADTGRTLCVPLLAQGTAIGVLHIRDSAARKEGDDSVNSASQALAETVAEQAALSLANLKLREELHELSISDPLTSLYNRRFAQETLTREIHRAHREQDSIGIITFDIDFFKRVNDRYGHDAGDAVLKAVAAQLQSSVRGGDIACRMGGEEFAIMMPGATLNVARQRAEELRSSIAVLRVRHAQVDLPAVSMSCGVAAFPDHGVTADALLRAADQALYRAKEAGRNRVEAAAAA